MSQNTLISDLLEKATKASKKNDFSNYAKDLIEAYRIRCVEQKFLELFSEAKISGTVHTSVGQELTGVVLSKYLDDYDWITSNHRCHGH